MAAAPIFCSHIPGRRFSSPSSSRPFSVCPRTLCSRCARHTRWTPKSTRPCIMCTSTRTLCYLGELSWIGSEWPADTLLNFSLCYCRFNFWIHSVIIKLLPCFILTVISLVLMHVLCEASRRRLKLKDYDNPTKYAIQLNLNESKSRRYVK